MENNIWPTVLDRLAFELTPQQFNTWIRPLEAEVRQFSGGSRLRLLAPNRFVLDWVSEKFLVRIEQLLQECFQGDCPEIELDIRTNGGQIGGHGGRFSRSCKGDSIGGRSGSSHNSDPMSQEKGFSHPFSAKSTVKTGTGNRVKNANERSGTSGLSGGSKNQSASSSVVASGCDGELRAPHNVGGIGGNRTYDAESARSERTTAVNYGQSSERLQKLVDENSHAKAHPGYDSRRKQASGSTSRSSEGRSRSTREIDMGGTVKHKSNLNVAFTFNSFVEGKSNQLARAAAMQVADNPGGAYNPLFLYGGVGLGKTHLMHAIGNQIMVRSPNAKVVYLHSERFVADMVKALQINAINEFKRFYRTVDALLIDDIQFFAGKDRSQEEFFHTFNALLEGGQQMILTSDRYPKEITDVEERLKSRFGWGLTVAVEPPELETRVAILMKKAEETRINLPHEAAFFIAKRIRSNVRELEGALKRVVANAHFTGQAITLEFVRESLKDLLAIQDKQVSVDNIQKTVADYFKIKVGDILSKRRSRSVARPRQVAMALSKELTNHSLPEIGDAFGGRDHTTVLHACRKIRELCDEDTELKDDYLKLLQMLTG